MNDPLLTPPDCGRTIELYPDRRWVRLEVDGRYMGEHVSFFCLEERWSKKPLSSN